MIDRERRRRRGQGGFSLPTRGGHRYEDEIHLQVESHHCAFLQLCVCVRVCVVIYLRGRMEKERKLPPSATGGLLAGELCPIMLTC